MTEAVKLPDGTPTDLDAAQEDFARAMATPPPDEALAPPKRAPRPQGDADAKAKPRGRPPKAARVTEPAPAPVTPELTKKRTEDTSGVVSAIGGAFLAVASMTGVESFKADAYTMQGFAEPIGKAAAEVAAVDPAFARYIDKSGAGGKALAYLGFFGVVAGLGAQVAANHGVVKPGTLGSHDPAEIIKAFESDEKPEGSPDGDDTPAS
jgi:hypothetical protein